MNSSDAKQIDSKRLLQQRELARKISGDIMLPTLQPMSIHDSVLRAIADALSTDVVGASSIKNSVDRFDRTV